LDKHEKVKKIIVMREDWTVDNDLITPTLKVKRNELEKLKADNFTYWYNLDQPVIWEDR
jgi:long-chain acyl-CoA synthetase